VITSERDYDSGRGSTGGECLPQKKRNLHYYGQETSTLSVSLLTRGGDSFAAPWERTPRNRGPGQNSNRHKYGKKKGESGPKCWSGLSGDSGCIGGKKSLGTKRWAAKKRGIEEKEGPRGVKARWEKRHPVTQATSVSQGRSRKSERSLRRNVEKREKVFPPEKEPWGVQRLRVFRREKGVFCLGKKQKKMGSEKYLTLRGAYQGEKIRNPAPAGSTCPRRYFLSRGKRKVLNGENSGRI